MRKLVLLITLAGSVFFYSCKGSGNKKGSASDSLAIAGNDTCKLSQLDIDLDSCTTSGTANFILDAAKAQKWIANFESVYWTATNGLQKHYWLNRCEIEGLANFFSGQDSLDGAWVIFASDSTAPYTSYIDIVPTRQEGGGYYHRESWASSANIPFPMGCNYSDHFKSVLDRRVRKFRDHHRQEGQAGAVDQLSRKIWVSKCVFSALHRVILAYDGESVKLDGVFVYAAAYDSTVLAAERGLGHSPQRPDQSTIILVPSYTCGDEHLPAWDVVKALYKHNVIDKMGMAGAPAYNHGELCPERCADADE